MLQESIYIKTHSPLISVWLSMHAKLNLRVCAFHYDHTTFTGSLTDSQHSVSWIRTAQQTKSSPQDTCFIYKRETTEKLWKELLLEGATQQQNPAHITNQFMAEHPKMKRDIQDKYTWCASSPAKEQYKTWGTGVAKSFKQTYRALLKS